MKAYVEDIEGTVDDTQSSIQLNHQIERSLLQLVVVDNVRTLMAVDTRSDAHIGRISVTELKVATVADQCLSAHIVNDFLW